VLRKVDTAEPVAVTPAPAALGTADASDLVAAPAHDGACTACDDPEHHHGSAR